MKRIIGLVAVGMLMCSLANAEGISTGKSTGTYFKVGHNIASGLGMSKDKVMESKGSVENLDRLVKGEADIALVQMDALAFYMSQNPSAVQTVEVIGPLYEECVYAAVNKNGKVKSENDLQKKGATIAIGEQGTGSVVTWDYMRQLEPGYKEAAVSFTSGNRALGKLASSPDSGLDAVMWVARPDANNDLLQTVMKNKSLKMISISDSDLNDVYKPTGKPVYRFDNLQVEKGFFADKVKTIYVDAVVVARSEADPKLLEKLSNLVLNYRETLLK